MCLQGWPAVAGKTRCAVDAGDHLQRAIGIELADAVPGLVGEIDGAIGPHRDFVPGAIDDGALTAERDHLRQLAGVGQPPERRGNSASTSIEDPERAVWRKRKARSHVGMPCGADKRRLSGKAPCRRPGEQEGAATVARFLAPAARFLAGPDASSTVLLVHETAITGAARSTRRAAPPAARGRPSDPARTRGPCRASPLPCCRVARAGR